MSLCANNGLLTVNLTIPGALDKILVAGDPDDPDDSDDSDSPSDITVTPVPDAYYEHCKQKGCALEWSMQHSDSEAGAQFAPPRMTAQSPFQTPQDLRDWGWHDGVKISQAYDDLSSIWWGADVALKGLQLPWKTDAQEGPNRLTIVVHQDPTADISVDKQTYKVDGKEYRASEADYTMTMNLQDGVIIAISRKGPDTAGKEREPPLKPEDMPKLHQFSDVGWIKWKAMTEANNLPVNNLRYFLSLGIANTQTISVCERIFRDNNQAMKKWPGDVFLAGTWDFRAILGKLHPS
ncbi:hypothetical protein J4E89_003033 [Alternaria sp. Ai002NY15]|nr:hypothetical protein J4E89_003033 [Alternaria sp. Ai002NY15]